MSRTTTQQAGFCHWHSRREKRAIEIGRINYGVESPPPTEYEEETGDTKMSTSVFGSWPHFNIRRSFHIIVCSRKGGSVRVPTKCSDKKKKTTKKKQLAMKNLWNITFTQFNENISELSVFPPKFIRERRTTAVITLPLQLDGMRKSTFLIEITNQNETKQNTPHTHTNRQETRCMEQYAQIWTVLVLRSVTSPQPKPKPICMDVQQIQ